MFSGSGKAGTLALMFAFPLFLWADAIHGDAHDVVLAAAWFMAISGLVFSYYAAATYVPLARAALREGRKPTAPTPRERDVDEGGHPRGW